MRSGEVGRGRLKVAGVFEAWLGRPDGFGSGDFVRIEIFLCSIDLYWFREPVL